MTKKITVVHTEDVTAYPPVISLLENLLDQGYLVDFISINIKYLPYEIFNAPNFNGYDIKRYYNESKLNQVFTAFNRSKVAIKLVNDCMKDSNYLWTTTALTVKDLGDTVLRYKHIMQLMELIEWYPKYNKLRKLGKFGIFRFPIEKYARKAWKVVVPEENRAYIQQMWWGLPDKPTVLPNKPYKINISVDKNRLDDNLMEAIQKIRNEKRKVILYLGFLSPERELDKFAEAIEQFDGKYCLYIVGGTYDKKFLQHIKKISKTFKNTEYLGYFRAPNHLNFLKYSYIGLLPYQPAKNTVEYISDLNTLYCAPNKIFEYAGYKVPMISTDVPGVTYFFKKFNCGVNLKDIKFKEITNAINKIELSYSSIQSNCKTFYDSVNLTEIVRKILSN